jgi:hypothetical protein
MCASPLVADKARPTVCRMPDGIDLFWALPVCHDLYHVAWDAADGDMAVLVTHLELPVLASRSLSFFHWP